MPSRGKWPRPKGAGKYRSVRSPGGYGGFRVFPLLLSPVIPPDVDIDMARIVDLYAGQLVQPTTNNVGTLITLEHDIPDGKVQYLMFQFMERLGVVNYHPPSAFVRNVEIPNVRDPNFRVAVELVTQAGAGLNYTLWKPSDGVLRIEANNSFAGYQVYVHTILGFELDASFSA